MADRYFTGEVDGIPLVEATGEDAGFILRGFEPFEMGGVTSSFIIAANGYPHEQSTPLGLYGHRVELEFLHCPLALYQAVRAKLRLRKEAGEGFPCTFTDGAIVIAADFKAAEEWLSRGNPDGDYINDVILRLISIGG